MLTVFFKNIYIWECAIDIYLTLTGLDVQLLFVQATKISAHYRRLISGPISV